MVEKRLVHGICADIKRHWLRFWRGIDILIARRVWKRFTKKIPVVKNQVMFRTFQDKYTCNPKYVCEELIKSGVDCKIVWVYSQKTGDLSQFPPQVKLVRFGTVEFYEAMAQSHYWIDNAHNFTWEAFPKKDEQVLINLWHGSMGLKRINPEDDSNRRRKKAGLRASKSTDYCVTNSKFEEDVFKSTYWPNTEFLKFGHARNDMMFSTEEQFRTLREEICKKIGLNPNDKFLLYAPTFRDDKTAFDCFNIDYPKLKQALEERFGGNWVVLQRLHFHTQLAIENKLKLLEENENDFENAVMENNPLSRLSDNDFVVSVSDYDDIQELMAISDAGVSDYSSWVCDFVLMKRPCFLFTTDIDSYVTERGFYYELTDTPFPICKNNHELISNVKCFDNDKYLFDIDKYLDMLGCYENGDAAERIVEMLKAGFCK
ncbi:MAG: CDP-glycerol glycerophosphotransferase family protein [Clostridia bacterium]|nr:CDP-glycerol glycerophosphotransferase family protein [Clostridia bacterium]